MLHLVLDLLTLIVTEIFAELFIWPMFQIKEETQSLSPAVSRGFPDVPPGFAPNFDRRVSGRGSLPIYGMWHMVCGKWYRLRGTMWTSVW